MQILVTQWSAGELPQQQYSHAQKTQRKKSPCPLWPLADIRLALWNVGFRE
jgi:hypothetical protein